MNIQQAGSAQQSKPWEEIAANGAQRFWEKAAASPAWYVVEAAPDKEFELAVSLQAALAPFGESAQVLHLVDVYQWQRRIVANGQIERRKLIRKVSRFGPLLFVRVAMSRGMAEALSNMPFTHEIVRCNNGERPVVVSDAMIEFYKGIAPVGALVEPTKIGFGDVVRIVNGPASGAQGVVVRVDNGRALRLDTSKFGGLAPLIIEASHVELVVQCQKRPIEPNVKSQAKRKRA